MRVPRYILLPLFLVLSLVAARAHTAPLPPIPSHVFSRWGPVPVHLVKHVVCGNPTPVGTIGCYNAIERRIQIADTLDLRWKTYVLEHEIVHVALRDMNISFDNRMDEDRIADALGKYRLWAAEAR